MLALSLGAFVACSWGYDAVDSLLFQPVTNTRVKVQAAAAKHRQLELDFQLVEHAQRNLNAVRDQSLPGEPKIATLLYQDWLLERVDDAGLDAVVTPNRAVAEEGVGHRIPFTVQATANLRQIGKFLDDFYSTPVLHRITFLTINNGGNSASTSRKITVTLEALALSDAPYRETLPAPDRSLRAHPSRPKLENYFARRDPFRRTTVTPSRGPVIAIQQPSEPVAAPQIDSLKTIRLVASIWQSGQREAWFFDSRTDREFIVTIGEQLKVADYSARVTSIDSDSITLVSNDQPHTTRLGQTLRESITSHSR
tara:strand:- start:11805 stop:12734 length:930 start_codon:yes stop_codon:yes gene_type:complete